MVAILSVLCGAIITGIIGNFLVQRWQMNSWRTQQRQLAIQTELEELKKLLDEITTKSANRLNAMRRLLSALTPDGRIEKSRALADYQRELATWNSSLNSMYIRIRLAVDYQYTLLFEKNVHSAFYMAGVSLENVIRKRNSGSTPDWTSLNEPSERLEVARVALYRFLRDLTDIVEKRRNEIYFGKRLTYNLVNLPEYSLFELIKVTLSSDVDSFYVVRTS